MPRLLTIFASSDLDARVYGTFGTLRYRRYRKVPKVPTKKNNGRMESEFIRPLHLSTKDTTAWFATKPWHHHLIYASVSAWSRDARIHSIRYIGLVQVQQPNTPCTRYASVSASCRDARTSQHNLSCLGLLQAQPPKLPCKMFMSVFIRLKDAHARFKRYFG